jgi:transcriptional regulator GlxA family with amidase domain
MTSRRVAVLAFPDVQVLDVTGPLEVFGRAARVLSDRGRRGPPAYEVSILARKRGPLLTSSGVELVARSYHEVGGVDTLLIAGGRGRPKAQTDPALIRWIASAAGHVRRLGSVCTGAFLLAEAGLLDGRRAVTHWGECAELARGYPRVRVDAEPVFIFDGVWTSAGVTAGMDMALAMVEEDFGRSVAHEVARALVMYAQRSSGQPQLSAHLASQLAEREQLRDVQHYVVEHLAEDLSVSALARRVAMSPRNFARAFRREVKMTPARFVEALRVEEARRLLEEADDGLEALATTCGFRSAEVLRRAFHRHLSVSPTQYLRGRLLPSGARLRGRG